MPTYVALLRAVNVAGRTLKMADLNTWLAEAGCRDVSLYLQTGNAVFCATSRSAEMLRSRLEAHLHKRSGMAISVLLRDRRAWQRIAAANPFCQRAGVDARKLHVTVLADAPTAAAVRALAPHLAPGEEFVCTGGVVYLYLPGGYGRSKLTNAYFERALGTRATTRNWRTVTALEQRLQRGS